MGCARGGAVSVLGYLSLKAQELFIQDYLQGISWWSREEPTVPRMGLASCAPEAEPEQVQRGNRGRQETPGLSQRGSL